MSTTDHDFAPNRPGLAAIWMVGAIVSFTLMAVAGRFTSSELDTFELMMFRSLIGVILVLVVGAYFDTLDQINFKKIHLHVFRNLFHFTGQNLWFFAIATIPLAQVVALEFTTPVWVILLAPVFLGERLSKTKLLAAFIGFSGIWIVARPDFAMIEPGVLSAAASAIGFAGAMIFTKILTRTASITCILFWLVALQAVFGIVTAGWDGDITLPSLSILPWVVVVAICGLTAHLSITTALTLAPASIVGPIDFFRLPIVFIVGMVFFSEPFELMILLGGGLILFANFLNIRSQATRKT